DSWTGVAISYDGLKALGLPETSLGSFPLAFQQGMAARAEQLRDLGENAPETWEDPYRPGTCHIALTIYARDDDALDDVLAKAEAELEKSTGITLIGTHRFGADEDAKNPFGFRDSISQPLVDGSGVALAMPQPAPLGRNGSYIVLRKYQSRIGAFNDFLREQSADEGEQDYIAAKMFGRWQSGAPLPLAPDRDDPELGADSRRNNDFSYEDDHRGLVCPHAAHMRRLNPRDSQLTILSDVNIHRIIRRSSTYGPKWSRDVTSEVDAQEDRGLFFIFISARAFDTIEFLQQEWINRGNFVDLGEERDPIVGLHQTPGTFTIPETPVRRKIDGVTTFNRLRGGEYMFMPSLTALRWIG
ncbi:MAG: peroxidase, partial [Citromicrobium sp.]